MKPKMPPKGMPPKKMGKHMMPDGHMMADAEMQGMMPGKAPSKPKVKPKKKGK